MKTYIERNMFDVWFFVRFNFFQFFLFDVTRAIDAHEYHEFVLLLKWAGDFRAVEHHVGELCQGYPWFAPLGPVYALWWGASKKVGLFFQRPLRCQKMDPPGVLQVFWAILIHQLTEAPRLRCQRCIRCEALLQLTDTILTGRCWINVPGSCDATVQVCSSFWSTENTQKINTKIRKWGVADDISFLKNAFGVPVDFLGSIIVLCFLFIWNRMTSHDTWKSRQTL